MLLHAAQKAIRAGRGMDTENEITFGRFLSCAKSARVSVSRDDARVGQGRTSPTDPAQERHAEPDETSRSRHTSAIGGAVGARRTSSRVEEIVRRITERQAERHQTGKATRFPSRRVAARRQLFRADLVAALCRAVVAVECASLMHKLRERFSRSVVEQSSVHRHLSSSVERALTTARCNRHAQNSCGAPAEGHGYRRELGGDTYAADLDLVKEPRRTKTSLTASGARFRDKLRSIRANLSIDPNGAGPST